MQIVVQDLPRNNLSEIQPLPFCNCWWNLMQPFGRTKRKSVQEPTGTVHRKRLAFGVPKDAATKTIIQRNSTESSLLRLPVEIRERIWAMVLGGGLIHVYTDPISTWYSTYCTVNDPKRFLSARKFARAADNNEGTGEANDGYPHRNYSEAYDPYLIFGTGDRRETHSFSDKDSKPYLQVLRTCRQIYLEASRVLWATNTFSFTRPETLKAFMNDRKTAQKQLLKNLHLNMTWNMKQHKRAWEKALTLTLVRSLKGLRAVHLRIEQSILGENSCIHSNPMEGEDLLNTPPFEEIMKFKILPLETVTVNIVNGLLPGRVGDGNLQWPLARRVECAESLESQLLDPEGAARWQERQEHLQELARQKNEQLAQYRATQICSRFSTEEECAEFYQKRQDDKDKRDGRVKKAEKIAGSCGRQHSCLICRGKASSDVDEEVPNCPRPGHCEEVEGTVT